MKAKINNIEFEGNPEEIIRVAQSFCPVVLKIEPEYKIAEEGTLADMLRKHSGPRFGTIICNP